MGEIRVGCRVGYIGPTIEKPWLPRGTEGTVREIHNDMLFPIICDFDIADGEDWPMSRDVLEVIRYERP